MIARVHTLQVDPDKIDGFIRAYRESAIPGGGLSSLLSQRGFRGLIALKARDGSGRMTGVTLWETDADIDANEASAYHQEAHAQARESGTVTAPVVPERFEVIFQTFIPEKAPAA